MSPIAEAESSKALQAGLASAEVRRKLTEFGYNELPSSKPRSFLRIALGVLHEPMLLLLVGCAATYFLLGDHGEALVLSAFVFFVIGIELYQERKTERALDALRDLSSPRAMVMRDGQPVRIAGREVVPGDLLILNEGDRVPADAVLVSETNLATDESLLTGESIPVRKQASQEGQQVIPSPGGDDLPFVYSGTLVVSGTGFARVLRTGFQTELGKIGKSLQSIESEPTLLEKDTSRVVQKLAIGGALLCAVLVVLYGVTRGDWLRGFLGGLTMAMAILPEELPVVLTVFLALGAWRISKVGVLTRRVPAVEMLGATTVLCVDKTGTLTMNQMEVQKLASTRSQFRIDPADPKPLPEEWHDTLEYAVLSSQLDAIDPMDRAIRRVGDQLLSGTEHLHADWTLVRQYPLAPGLLAISQVWRSPDGSEFVIASKGAPEAIAELCHLGASDVAEIQTSVASLAAEGLRVLGVAKARFRPADLPASQHDFNFEFLGLIALADPIRASVPGAVAECKNAGVRVVMITGDYPGTAQAIARQIGIPDASTMTGTQVSQWDDATLGDHVRDSSIFARAVPEHKLRLVQALKAKGEVVAMTGDGVNDAPALKASHIGIAMGARGTDVAREAADLVLLNDDFTSIVEAIRVGRRIFDNLKKAVAYILAIHVPIAGLSFLPVLFKWPMILGPVHIAFLELIIDPACSIVFEQEPVEAGIMSRPPRPAAEGLFEKSTVRLSLLQGLGVLLTLLAIFAIALYRGQGEDDARALTFTSLAVMNLSIIATNRSALRHLPSILRSKNNSFWWVVAATFVLLGLILYVPALRTLFRFSVLHPLDIVLCLSTGVVGLAWMEALKWFSHRSRTSPTGHI